MGLCCGRKRSLYNLEMFITQSKSSGNKGRWPVSVNSDVPCPRFFSVKCLTLGSELPSKSSFGSSRNPPGGLIKLFNLLNLFNVAQKMGSVHHKELEYEVEKLRHKKLEVMQPRIKSKSKLPAGE